MYVYKGLFNMNINYNSSEGILLDFVMNVCMIMVFKYIAPEGPENENTAGLTFDKHSPYDYTGGS